MSRLVGLKTSLSGKNLHNSFAENHGEGTIKTEDIQQGWDKLKRKLPKDLFTKLKQSPHYVKGSE